MTEMVEVLYVSFGRPRKAKESIEVEDGVIYHMVDNEIMGIIITNFKARTLKQ